MTLLFCDSFDHYATGDILEKWDVKNDNPAIVSGAGRNGTGALSLPGYNRQVRKSVGHEAALCCGFWLQINEMPPTVEGPPILHFMDGTTAQAALRVRSDGLLALLRGATVVATSTSSVAIDTEYYVELCATVDNASGTMSVYVNGEEWASFSGNTQATANAYITDVWFMADWISFTVDDVYIATERLGDVRVIALAPSGAGNYAQFTPSAGDNYANVDESAPDDDTTYNASSTAGHKDSFAMGNLPEGLTGTVLGVQTLLNCRKDDAGERTMRVIHRIGGTDYAGATVSIGDSYAYQVREIDEVNPATGVAWTTSEIDALEAGYELVS